MRNIDEKTVAGFGAEWTAFDQTGAPRDELDAGFDEYFRLFPWQDLPADAIGADLGCGSGRWAARVAPRVGQLHCLDASREALAVAQRTLAHQGNVSFHVASVGDPPLERASLDFAYCLGVLHHVPDPAAALAACVHLLKPNAPLLVYLYYALDERPRWYRGLWKASDAIRRRVSCLPHPMKLAVANATAVAVYWPLARLARFVERLGRAPGAMPLAIYRNKSLYTMRTDALDRFGTRLEQRFTSAEVEALMHNAGLGSVQLSPDPPYWCALGRRSS